MPKKLLMDEVPLLPTSTTFATELSPSRKRRCCPQCVSFDPWKSLGTRDRRQRCQLFALATTGFTIVALVFLLSATELHALLTSGSSFPTDNLQYAVVVDAGSSGSRAYLYAWPAHSGNPHDLLHISPLTAEDGSPLFKKVTPGLSSFQDHPDGTLDYFTPLLTFAMDHIPPDKVKETPLFILATAGMRLVESEKQKAILDHLLESVNRNFDFLFPEGNLEVISGRQEGIYQWLAINYVLGKFHHKERQEMVVMDYNTEENGENVVFRPPTVGAIDMGGASMQIAMEITSQAQMDGLSEKERSQVTELNLGCKEHDMEHTYRIFVTTFLGYGANEALGRHQRDLILSQVAGPDSVIAGFDKESRVLDPCLPKDHKEETKVQFSVEKMNASDAVKAQLRDRDTIFLTGTGDWNKCFSSIKIFTKQAEKFSTCEEETTCHDTGIRVPVIPFEKAEFYGFSEFWYSMEDVLRMGGQYSYSTYRKAAENYCQASWPMTLDKYNKGHYPKSDRQRLASQCFKSTWLMVALHEGLGFPKTYTRLSSAPDTVNGHVVHWTLGALLYRTRFIPLRAIEARAQEQIHKGTYHSAWASGYLYSHYVVLICLLLVISAILIYLHRLKRYVKPSTLRKVPSLSFWIPSSEAIKPPRNEEQLLTILTGDPVARGKGGQSNRPLFFA